LSVTDGDPASRPDQAAVFEEFRQVRTAEKKAKGQGWGSPLPKFSEPTAGGWGQSEVGGADVPFTIPVRHGK
jgi:hypothetical protein